MKHQEPVKIIECPRDAMQGWPNIIPTTKKVAYLNQLLKMRFDTVDFGSFVSHKAIPQMADTAEVITQVDISRSLISGPRLLAIIANLRGAEMAVNYAAIRYLGFPFSISETFQQRNANSSISQAFDTVKAINALCQQYHKELVIYISMGFGNPYGDFYDKDLVLEWSEKFHQQGIKIISLADTVGLAEPQLINYLYENLIPAFPDIAFGAHFHTRPDNWKEKVDAAFKAGCRRFDSAIHGFGGCPMAKDELVGNLSTEHLLQYLQENNIQIKISDDELAQAGRMAEEIFI